jgi:hypothetical protein
VTSREACPEPYPPARLALAVLLALVTSGRATGKDAVVVGDTFSFVAPGGRTQIAYAPRPLAAP